MTEDEVAKIIIDTAYDIHVRLGPGLPESGYQEVLAYEWKKRGLQITSSITGKIIATTPSMRSIKPLR